MSRKIKIALVISTIAALLVVGAAAAKGGPNDGGGKSRGQSGAVGQVVAIDGDQVTVEKQDGTQVVIQVNDDTRYFVKDSEDEVSLADIEVGMWIGGRAEADDDGNLVARAIVILPDDFDPEAARDGAGTRGAGTVVSVSGDSITVETADAETLVLTATADTRFGGKNGSIESLSDLETGDTVGFAYSEADDGTLELLAIGAGGGRDGNRGVGTVVSVSGDSVTVETADAETLVLTATADTRFGGKNGSIESLSDLEAGDPVGFAYSEADDGTLELLAIGESRRPAGTRGAGRVVSVSGDSVTVETADDETLVLTATEDTRFGGKDGSIESLSDLEAGDPVGFAYSEADDGALELLAIGVGGGGKGKGGLGGGKGFGGSADG